MLSKTNDATERKIKTTEILCLLLIFLELDRASIWVFSVSTSIFKFTFRSHKPT